MFFTLSLPFGYSSLSLSPSASSFSLLLLPLFFPNIADALTEAPALCAPARVARAMASDFHANLNFAAGVVSGALTACGSTPLAAWGALPKRRGNAGSDSELPYHLNTFLEVRWVCVFASALALALALSLALSPSLSLSATHPTLPPHARTRISSPLTYLTLSPLLLVRLLLRLAFSSSLSYLLPLCSSSSSPHPLLLLLVCVFLLSRLLLFFCFRISKSMLAQATLASGSVAWRGERW